MKIVLLGAPGAGKGTLAAMITEKYKIPHISTGDIFRDNIRELTPLGIIAKSYIDKGELCPDDVTIDLVRDALVKPEYESGFILDGFPRTLLQAKALDKMLKSHGLKLALALNIYASDDSIILRISGRRVCPHCGASYHIVYIQPKVENICDVCSTQLIHRDDDNPETIKKRLDTYHKKSEPLVEYYRNQGLLVEIESTHGVSESWNKLQTVLESLE
ncbi:MAG: adenylate kinase [Clostridia bacterium]